MFGNNRECASFLVKIRHYEKDSLCVFHWILWCLRLSVVNMLVAPKADPLIGLSFFAVIFIVCFIIGLFDYDRKMKKKAEEEKRQAEKEQTDRNVPP